MSRAERTQEAAEKYAYVTYPSECFENVLIEESFVAGAEWCNMVMLRDIHNWLKDNANNYCNGTDIDVNMLTKDLIKAMEE